MRAPSYALPLTKAQWALELLGRSLGLVGWYAVGVLLVADASFGLSVLARVVCMALFANCTFLGVSILASLVAALHRQVPLRRSALWTWGVVPVGVVFSTVYWLTETGGLPRNWVAFAVLLPFAGWLLLCTVKADPVLRQLQGGIPAGGRVPGNGGEPL